jgi:excisionase family DNA binding protein
MNMSTVVLPIRMNLRDAAKHLGVSDRKFQRLVRAGDIRYVTDPGGVRMYPTSELRGFLDRQIQEQWGQQQVA